MYRGPTAGQSHPPGDPRISCPELVLNHIHHPCSSSKDTSQVSHSFGHCLHRICTLRYFKRNTLNLNNGCQQIRTIPWCGSPFGSSRVPQHKYDNDTFGALEDLTSSDGGLVLRKLVLNCNDARQRNENSKGAKAKAEISLYSIFSLQQHECKKISVAFCKSLL